SEDVWLILGNKLTLAGT
uniref:Uncharacterized protein n=1 Tax=Amphimedon queenslandica TaxID=400682 RepID=A0A1X7TL32_AMPQE